MNGVGCILRRRTLIALGGIIVTAILFATARRSAADDRVGSRRDDPTPIGSLSVSVLSGRTFEGQLDPQTDRELLWLRVGEGAIVLRRPIEWSRVVRVRQGNKELSPDELRAIAHSAPAATREPLLPPPPVPATDWTVAKTWLTAPANRSAPAAPPSPVAALQIDVELGHWTPGVEPSGIVVCIHPTTADGSLAPVDATMAVDLIGQRPASEGAGDGLATIGRWTQAVRAGDFGPLGAEFRFPFQAVHPDFDLELRAHGLVHVRLSVPGQGTFAASQALVRLRPYSAVRDRLQEHTGSRFAPIEETDR
ncbi:MAG TPA: hypothetical protein VHX65_18190 [Pirellulales bacterium]|nr:hypothetical protein [Pirellulales bacterium]